MADLLKKYDGRLRLSFRDYPLRSIHPQAQAAAEAARCAGEQGRFWEYHDRLFAHQDKLGAPDLDEHAAALHLDIPKFKACFTAGAYRKSIDTDLQDGGAAGVAGTPAFFINGVFVNGAAPAAAFEKVIEEELSLRSHSTTSSGAQVR